MDSQAVWFLNNGGAIGEPWSNEDLVAYLIHWTRLKAPF